MNTVSSLNLRGALADPALRESLLVSAVMLVASAGLTLLGSWLWVLFQGMRRGADASLDWLVVCGHVLERGRPTPIYRQRLRRAAELALADSSLEVLIAGGGEPSEAAVGRDWLAAQGAIEPARVRLEENSTDTFENLRHARGLLPPKARVGLVSSRFHLARVLAYARQLGLDAVAVPAEPTWRFTPGNLLASLREAGFLCWFLSGRFWARLARRRRLLERLH